MAKGFGPGEANVLEADITPMLSKLGSGIGSYFKEKATNLADTIMFPGQVLFGKPSGEPFTQKELIEGAMDLSALVAGGGIITSGVKKGAGETLLGMNVRGKDIKLGPTSVIPSEVKKKRLLILSCGGKKCADIDAVQALDRYTGPMYQQVKKSIRDKTIPEDLDIAILSAEHGLISSKLPIKNYDTIMTPERAKKILTDPDQVNRIKNTASGYDEIIVQGSPKYTDVIEKATDGLPNLKKITGSYLNMRGQLGRFLRGED